MWLFASYGEYWSFKRWEFTAMPLSEILTRLADIANGKKSCSVLQQFTEEMHDAIWCRFFDVTLPIDHAFFTLDGVTFLRVINVRNTYKRLRYSQTFGGISTVQWRKVGRIRRIQLLFRRFLFVRIETDQLFCAIYWVISHFLSVSCKQINHSLFALVIWSLLQLISKQWSWTIS